MIVFDASTVVGAALREDGLPARALLRAEAADFIALSDPVAEEIAEVLGRRKFERAMPPERRRVILGRLIRGAMWFVPTIGVTDCRDAKDNKYLELALAAGAQVIVSSDEDLLVLDPWRGVRVLRPVDYLAGG